MCSRFPQIHGVGDVSLLERPRIAIVGARKATQGGRRRAAQLARDCARAGVVVVSGLAEGIDHAAHTAAIEHDGRTIAVIGTPLDKVYSTKHGRLQRRIYREHLLLSPFTWGGTFVPSNFPGRTRIMAHLALVQIGHPVFIAAGMLEDAKLRWPKRFVGDDKPLGRILRTTSDVIGFALATRAA